MTKPKTPSVMSTGYCTLDVIRHDGRISHSAGGTAANVAANLAYFGWSSMLAARFGYDAPARRILSELRRAGINTDLVERDHDVETPVILHDVKPPVHRFLFACPTCGRRFPRFRPISDTHADTRILVANQLAPTVFFFDRASAPAIRLAEEMRSRGSLVVFEPSSRGVAARTLQAAATAHIVKVSHERRKVLDPAVLTARSGQLQIETLGAGGLLYRTGAGAWKRLAAPPTTVVDSAGAGDWFTTGLLLRFGPPPSTGITSMVEAALHQGQALAALGCRLVGARALARVPRRIVDRALDAPLRTEEPELPRLSWGTRSKAKAVCPVCLGPPRRPV